MACLVPYGVFIGCQDLDVCKTFAASACMVHWVRETCKSKCGTCGYGEQNIKLNRAREYERRLRFVGYISFVRVD